MRVPAGPTDWSWRTRPRRPRGKSAVDSDVWSTPWEVTPSMPDHASTSGPTMCPTGSTLQITRRDRRPRWTMSPPPLNAERRLPRSTVLVATATIRVVATEGQIYGRQLQQAGDYTGPDGDPPADKITAAPQRPGECPVVVRLSGRRSGHGVTTVAALRRVLPGERTSERDGSALVHKAQVQARAPAAARTSIALMLLHLPTGHGGSLPETACWPAGASRCGGCAGRRTS